MKRPCLLALVFACALVPTTAGAADNLLDRLVTCQDSWYEGKDNPAQMKQLAETFNNSFKQQDRDPAFLPKAKVQVLGLSVVRAYPESVGMGVGFSIVVDAPFEKAKAALEKAAGKALAMCDSGDGMRSCELEIAPKRSLVVMSGENGKSKSTLIGCYYFYEK